MRWRHLKLLILESKPLQSDAVAGAEKARTGARASAFLNDRQILKFPREKARARDAREM